jgi:hypothetical protein
MTRHCDVIVIRSGAGRATLTPAMTAVRTTKALGTAGADAVMSTTLAEAMHYGYRVAIAIAGARAAWMAATVRQPARG